MAKPPSTPGVGLWQIAIVALVYAKLLVIGIASRILGIDLGKHIRENERGIRSAT